MSKRILGILKLKTDKFYRNKIPVLLRDVDIEKMLASNKIPLVEETISTLLVTCTMMIKLSHYV